MEAYLQKTQFSHPAQSIKIRGFTLIELVVTLLVVAVIGITGANILKLGIDSYTTSSSRQDNQVKAKFVIEKMSRELRHAVPNSFDVFSDSKCLRFAVIQAVAFYTELPEVGERNIELIFFENFVVNDDFINSRLIINPNSPSDLLESDNNRFVTIQDVTSSNDGDSVMTVRFSSRHDPAFISNSSVHRAYIYKPEFMSYCISEDKIYRNDKVIGNQIENGAFVLNNTSFNRNSTVRITLQFKNQLDEIIQYQHDVQVFNVP